MLAHRYQHVGLDWLANMHARKLNGILADEMGLGKTIQTIALLAHIAVTRNNWGPHLIIVPTSVMLNWEHELKKWCPAFKVLTYMGTVAQRQEKRRGWTKPDAFHVCITSYKLAVQDAQSFKLMKWKYLILGACSRPLRPTRLTRGRAKEVHQFLPVVLPLTTHLSHSHRFPVVRHRLSLCVLCARYQQQIG